MRLWTAFLCTQVCSPSEPHRQVPASSLPLCALIIVWESRLFTGAPSAQSVAPPDSGLVQQSFRRIKTYVFVLLLSLVSVLPADLTARLSWIKWD